MECLHPKEIYSEVLMPSGLKEFRKVHVPCGTCDACLITKQIEWRIRLSEEFRDSESAIFFTLTYAPEHRPYHLKVDTDDWFERHRALFSRKYVKDHIPSSTTKCGYSCVIKGYSDREIFSKLLWRKPVVRGSDISVDDIDSYIPVVWKKDVQDFMKRLRRACEPFKIRFFLVSEYSPINQLPHYHGIIFNYPRMSVRKFHYVLEKAWKNGFVTCDPVTGGRINYCAKYCVKPYENEDLNRIPPFKLLSRMPAIGSGYLNRLSRIDWHLENLSDRYVDVKGLKKWEFTLPRYYKNKIFTEEQRSLISMYHRIRQLFGDDVSLEEMCSITDAEYCEKEIEMSLLELTESEWKKKLSEWESIRKRVRSAHKKNRSSELEH